jgi:hypothetical protein
MSSREASDFDRLLIKKWNSQTEFSIRHSVERVAFCLSGRKSDQPQAGNVISVVDGAFPEDFTFDSGKSEGLLRCDNETSKVVSKATEVTVASKLRTR